MNKIIIILILLSAIPAYAGKTTNVTSWGDTDGNLYGNADSNNMPTLDPNNNVVNINQHVFFGQENGSGETMDSIAIVGAKSSTAQEVSGNIVNITSGLSYVFSVSAGSAEGSQDITMDNNIVNVDFATLSSIEATYENTITIVAEYTGIGKGILKNNKVYIKNARIGSVYGVLSLQSSFNSIIDSNFIYLDKTTLNKGSVYGGNGRAKQITNNFLEIKDSQIINTNTAGGISSFNVVLPVGDYEISSNTVSITNTSHTGNIYGGYWKNTAKQSYITTIQVKNNTINLSGGTFSGSLIGGYADSYNATGNDINISGNATFTESTLYGGSGGIATNNYINIQGGDFKNTTIYGGYADNPNNLTITFEASNNTVSIENGTFSGSIYGGYSNVASNANVINNTINISGNVNLSNVYLYGGFAQRGRVSGNTLNLETNINALRVEGFDNYNFYTDNTTITPMLQAMEIINMDNSVIGLYLKENSRPLQAGDKLWLVSNMSGKGITQANNTMRAGATMLYDWELLVDDGSLYAKIKDDTSTGGGGDGGDNGNEAGRLNPETKALSEGYLSSMGMLISGADLVADSGLSALDSSLQEGSNGMFSSLSAQSVRLNSGSHVDVQSGSLILGLGSKIDNYIWGAFLEAGGGKHNTYNEFKDSTVKGDGSNAYAGAGVLGRLNFDFMYVDVSARGGYIITDYKADYSVAAKYNIGSLYYGGHVGAGLVQNINNNFTLNEYVKYLATMQQGGKVVLDSKEEINFADVMSSRAVAGLRAKYLVGYVGYAYEQELNGEAKATASNPALNTAIEAPVIKGGTSILEAGYEQTFSERASRFSRGSSFNVGFGGKYYIGVRNGYSVNAKVGYMF
ncbi:MAG: hypothetical protein LBQ34_00960 [Alphaproteobacteria bacterium]|jgi:hypothetical protein|nr:hypothetical protein [Alphaproteobacteria bacterium]